MHRIDGQDATFDNKFQAGDPSIGQRATEITAAWLTALQEEVGGVVEASGATLNKPDNTQLLAAILTLVGWMSSHRNVVINGDFSVSQRGSTFTNSTGTPSYCLDRWRFAPGTANSRTVTIERKAHTAGQTAVPGDPTHYVEWSYAAGGTNGSVAPQLQQRIENAWTLNNGKATLTFWARVTAGSTTIVPSLRQDFGGGGSSPVTVTGPTLTLTTTWTKYSVVFDVPSTAGKTFQPDHLLELRFETLKTYDVGTGKFQMDLVQLERGANASTFEFLAPGQMRTLCERYFETTSNGAVFNSEIDCVSSDEDTLNAEGLRTRFRVEKRVIPNVLWYAPSNGAVGYIDNGGTPIAVSGTTATGKECTGVPSAGSGLSYCRAHWSADAEL